MAGSVLVGVDDSEGGRCALTWALREADLRHATVEVLYAWAPAWAEGFNTEWPADRSAFTDEARTMLAGLIAESQAESGSSIVPHVAVVEGIGAGPALVKASADVDLLVVGSRGRGGFLGLALGSVSTACVHHARCPVVVVRPPDASARPG
jgi:nucleotide-binding universal stress UspA family protein